jgi:hypothetical protein
MTDTIAPYCDDCARSKNLLQVGLQHYGRCFYCGIIRACWGDEAEASESTEITERAARIERRRRSTTSLHRAHPNQDITYDADTENVLVRKFPHLAFTAPRKLYRCQCNHSARWLFDEIAAKRWVHEFREYRTHKGTVEYTLVCLSCRGEWNHTATDRLVEMIMALPARQTPARARAKRRVGK